MTGLLPLLLASLAVSSSSADNPLSCGLKNIAKDPKAVTNNEPKPSNSLDLKTKEVLSQNAEAENVSKATESFGKSIQKKIEAVKTNIQATIDSVEASQCTKMKKIYEIFEGEQEPDLNTLTLEYRDADTVLTFNITTAAELIPQSREFVPDQKLFIFVHGFTDDPSQAAFTNVSQALLSRGNHNVLALDASSLIHWMYIRSTTYVKFIGEKLGEVLAAMVYEGMDPSAIHVIGHSLGCHISSFTGKTFTSMTGLKLGRITGLDPAGPCFSDIDQDLRLNETDAQFVDVIHTDAGVKGLKYPVGQVDYYPNGGSQQPNCQSDSCSHARAWQYFVESVIREDAFLAVKCKDWEAFKKNQCEDLISPMGFASKPGTTGLYFLQTDGDSPFGLGKAGLVWANNESIEG